MVMDTGAITALLVGFFSACLTVVFLIAENKNLQKKIRILQVSLRDERRKNTHG